MNWYLLRLFDVFLLTQSVNETKQKSLPQGMIKFFFIHFCFRINIGEDKKENKNSPTPFSDVIVYLKRKLFHT